MRKSILVAVLLTLAAAIPPAEAGIFGRIFGRVDQHVYTYSAPPAAYTAVQSYGVTDASGFVVWLNVTRSRYSLRPVVADPTLAYYAAANNAQQAARGLGHYVMGPATRQDAAMGSYQQAVGMWMSDYPHRANLLAPEITRVALVGSGNYWTYNAN